MTDREIVICKELTKFVGSFCKRDFNVAKHFYELEHNIEEPVSEELEKAAEEFRKKIRPLFETFKDSTGEPVSAYDQNDMVAMFKAGAKWQKKKTINKAIEWIKEKCSITFSKTSTMPLEEGWKSCLVDIGDFRKTLEEG